MSSLTLIAPDPVQVVTIEKVSAGMVPVDNETRSKLEEKADIFIRQLLEIDHNSPEFSTKVSKIANIGQKEIAALSAQTNRFLDRPTHSMDGRSGVGKSLIELRHIVEKLDPGNNKKLLKSRRLFGIIPIGRNLKAYFDKYQSSQTHIQAILAHLGRGKDELFADIIAIDGERRKMWEEMGKLEQMIVITKAIDTKIDARIAELEFGNPEKANTLKKTALFYVRQRTQDLLTQMAVTVQGYLALELIKQNNEELIKGVVRASTTTIAALRTAVTVAQALANQELVLEQISELNATTSNIIDATSTLLHDQTGKIHEQAASSTIQVEVLQRAFQNIYETMDMVDEFKSKALGNMKTTIDVLSAESEKAKGYITRSEGANRQAVSENSLLSA